jgi:HlyD family secretion protein
VKAISQKGDTLAILDLPEVDAKIQQAEGAVTSAKAQYNMAKGRQLKIRLYSLKKKTRSKTTI